MLSSVFFSFMFSFEELRCSTRKVLHPHKFVDCLCDSVNRFLFCTSCRLVRRPRDLLRLMPVPMATLKGTLKVWWWYVSAVMGVSTQRRASLLVASGGGRMQKYLFYSYPKVLSLLLAPLPSLALKLRLMRSWWRSFSIASAIVF